MTKHIETEAKWFVTQTILDFFTKLKSNRIENLELIRHYKSKITHHYEKDNKYRLSFVKSHEPYDVGDWILCSKTRIDDFSCYEEEKLITDDAVAFALLSKTKYDLSKDRESCVVHDRHSKMIYKVEMDFFHEFFATQVGMADHRIIEIEGDMSIINSYISMWGPPLDSTKWSNFNIAKND